MKPYIIKQSVLIAIIINFCLPVYSQNLETLNQNKPISIKGSVGASMIFFDATGRPSNRPPFSWALIGSPVLDIYGITFPFSFTISDQERDFRQPFNKIGVSPYYKWAKLHLGYRNLNFSPYTLAGHTILGAGIELKPGNFRTGFIYGRLLRAVPLTALNYDLNKSYVSTPAYQRKTWSFKAGYGTENNYADIILFKGWDDASSLDVDPAFKNIMPAENFIVSFVTHQKLGKRFNFEFEYAKSLYVLDSRVSAPDTSGKGFLEPFSFLYKSNSSSYLSSALDSKFGYSGQIFTLNIRYKRVEPDFRSMGAYFFQNDLENITIEPMLKFNKEKYTLSASLGLQHDNLNNKLPNTTKRTIGSLNLNGTPSQRYNFNINYSNYDLGQSAGATPVDSLYELSQTTQNLSVNQNLNFMGETFVHYFIVSYNFQKLNDKNRLLYQSNSFTTNILIASYMVSYMPVNLNITIGYSYTTFDLSSAETSYMGPNLSISKSFMKNTLAVSLSENLFTNSSTDNNTLETTENNLNRVSLNLTYRLAKKHRFTVKGYINKSTSDTVSNNYNEKRGELGYVYTF